MQKQLRVAVIVSLGGVVSGCEGGGGAPVEAPGARTREAALETATSDGGGVSAAVTGTGFGDPIPGLTDAERARFEAGKAEFTEVEEAEEGLGPVFNDTSCAACHGKPAVGGGDKRLETRIGTRAGGKFDPLTAQGGSLIQEHGIGVAGDCDYVGELVPSQATVRAPRKSTPLFGLGLVDAVPDAVLEVLAVSELLFPGEAGRLAPVHDLARNSNHPGRFGWKDQVPTLHQFAGDAYLNELGITTPEFPDETCPQGDCSLLRCNPLPELNDDGSGITALQDFMTMLGPPPRGPITEAVTRGEKVFETVACNHCHTETLVTGNSPIAALRVKTFHPYSDFLLHDMGSLGDGLELGAAHGREFRTAPLWGLREQTAFLHDGSASSIAAAIQAHDGQGKRARDAFAALSPEDRDDLIQFLSSL